jgi:hypothetical protein
VFVNRVRVFDGKDYVRLGKGPGQVLDRYLPARAAGLANAASNGGPWLGYAGRSADPGASRSGFPLSV